jgi:PmbA protein
VKSTGNGSRSSYTSPPSVGLGNFINRLSSGGRYCKYFLRGFRKHNYRRSYRKLDFGDFSVEARNAFTIKDGALDKPVKSIMISGIAFELLKNITGAGLDVRKVGGIITPSIRVSV